MLVVGYSNPKDLSYIIRKSNEAKSEELINGFLNKFLQEKEDQEKFKKIFFEDNTFEYTSLMPIHKYFEYKMNMVDIKSQYTKKGVYGVLEAQNITTVDEQAVSIALKQEIENEKHRFYVPCLQSRKYLM